MTVSPFDFSRPQIVIDTYNPDYAYVPMCDQRYAHASMCSNRAGYQVRLPSEYDGTWQQACDRHLSIAVEAAIAAVHALNTKEENPA